MNAFLNAVNGSSRDPIDFAALMRPVAEKLLGNPNNALSKGDRLRFGSKGSMEVDTEAGWFDDHEAGVRGGVLALVMHKQRTDEAGAFAWLEAEGLKASTPRAAGNGSEAGHKARSIFYDYRDESGSVAFRVERRGKDAVPPFLQHGPDGRGGFHAARGVMHGVRRVPYRLPELLAADPSQIVFVTEGEKDADRLGAAGLIATTNPGGACKFTADLATFLSGRRVVALQDNDEPGKKHVAQVLNLIQGKAAVSAALLLPGLPEKGDVSDWLDGGGSVEDLMIRAEAVLGKPAADLPLIKATPFEWRDASTIPVRPWVYGRWLLRNTITAVVAPGGIGKSSLMASTVLALATGRQLLGKTVWDGPQRVWLWNLEDDGDELARQIHAAAKQHDVSPADCGDRLLVDSGLDGAELCVAIEDRDGFRILRPVIEALVAELINREIDVLIVDPFVSSHQVSENDNNAIDLVAKEWAKVAKRAGCSIALVHHTKKLAGQKVTAEASRGAVALINAARSALVLNRMDDAEAVKFGIADDAERRRYFSVQDDKHNRAPAEAAEWYRMEGVDLGNGGQGHGDNIGVVTRWTPPDAFDGISTNDLRRVQGAIADGRWRKSDQSPDWVGVVVADVLELDLEQKTDKARVKRIVAEWLKNGALREEQGKDDKGNQRPFVVVGRFVDDHSSPLPHHAVRTGEEVGARFPTTTAPIKGAGGEETEAPASGRGYRTGENPALGSPRF